MTETTAAQASAPQETRISNGIFGKMKLNPSDMISARNNSSRLSSSKPDNDSSATSAHASNKKRRKVNHGKFDDISDGRIRMSQISIFSLLVA